MQPPVSALTPVRPNGTVPQRIFRDRGNNVLKAPMLTDGQGAPFDHRATGIFHRS